MNNDLTLWEQDREGTHAPAALPQRDRGDAADLARVLTARFEERIAAEIRLPARNARWAPFPNALDVRLRRALQVRGIDALYIHQHQALLHAQAGRHVVVATPTASGKSLCYHLPVLQSVLATRAKALYLFPTKALAQDQVAELLELNAAGNLGVRAHTFDGDTPGDARRAVRTQADIVVSNPDMLHQAILPHHTKWAQFLESLAYVVIDEVHSYRGVFGSHVANVLRRLRRICRFYGTRPTYVLCSATIANPQELAEQLLEERVEAVLDCGAPQVEKSLLVWNPPLVNPDLGIRASARSQSARLARHALRRRLKTIVFANSRLEVEVLTKYLKDVFDRGPLRASPVAAYRGGYLPLERRATEHRLRTGELEGVVTTSALELGVDIGGLDVCILNGYPGSIAATWQRFGRAGRRGRPALAVLVVTSQLLDQYIARHPDFFFGASPEHARVAPDQLLILMDHVRCAAFELPFHDAERFGSEDLQGMLAYLEQNGVVHREGQSWHWIADSYPANSVSLRTIADGNFTVIDITGVGKKVIAEVDYSAAALTLYEGAIHLIQARPWQVERLDWTGRKAFVRATDADYYTEAIDYTRLKPLDVFESAGRGGTTCAHGEVHVVRRVAGYKKIRYYSHENVGYGAVRLPDHEMHTTAIWWQIDPEVLEDAFDDRVQALDGFLGAAYALHHVAALVCLSELRDLGRAVGDGGASWSAVVGADGRGTARTLEGNRVDLDRLGRRFRPVAYLYDNYPGGIGLAAPLYERREEIVLRAQDIVTGCPCQEGCPACVGPVLPRSAERAMTAKAAAERVLVLFLAPAPPRALPT